MDPLSISASIAALLHVTRVVLEYARDVKNFGGSRQELLDRATDLRIVLEQLGDRERKMRETNPNAPWYRGLRALVDPALPEGPEGSNHRPGASSERKGALSKIYEAMISCRAGSNHRPGESSERKGALSKIHEAMIYITNMLGIPPDGKGKIRQRFMWPYEKEKLEKTFKDIKRWQSQVVLILQQDEFALSGDTNNRIRETVSGVTALELSWARREKDQTIARERKARAKEKDAIINWLSPLDFLKRHQEISKNRCPNIGQNLLSSQEFQIWARGAPWTLSCLAMAGAGKTVLCSIVIDNLRIRQKMPVLFLYLHSKESDGQTIEALVGSLLKQLLQRQTLEEEFRSEAVRKIYQDSKREAPPMLVGLLEALQEEILTYPGVIVVIDALDEALPDLRVNLLHEIESLAPNKLHVMTTSRQIENEYGSGRRVECSFCHKKPLRVYYKCGLCDDVDVCHDCKEKGEHGKDPLHVLYEPFEEVPMDISPTEEEIQIYVDWALTLEIDQGTKNRKQRDQRLSHVNERTTYLGDICRENADSNLQERIRKSVVTNTQGMFMLAKLYMDSIKSKTSAEEIEESLQQPPSGYADSYNQALERIRNFSMENPNTNASIIGMRALSFVAFTYRVLKLPELQEALSVDPRRPTFRMKKPYSRKVIFDCTAGLLDIQSDMGEVRLVHLTAEEHFHKNRSSLFPDSSIEIVQILLQYVSREEFAKPCQSEHEDTEFEERQKKHHLLAYAYQNWGKHVAETESDPQVQSLVMQFLSKPSRVDAAIQAACYLNPEDLARWDVRKGANALHLCAWFGLASTIRQLVMEQGIDVNSQDPTYAQTPLMYACRQGHAGTVATLLDLGADINLRSRRRKTAMLEAVAGDHVDVITLLLGKRELDINATHELESSRTALMLACQQGKAAVVKSILGSDKCKLTVNEKDAMGNTALILAAESDQSEIVEMLAQLQSLMIDATNKTGNTALTLAARKNSTEVVRVLAMSGASPSVKNLEDGGNALTWAVDNGNEEILRLLFTPRAKLFDTDENGLTLLHRAAAQQEIDITQLLIEQGLDIDLPDDKGRTPLHHASRSNGLGNAKLLLRLGANPHAIDNAGRTPSTVAWQYGHARMMEIYDHVNDDLALERYVEPDETNHETDPVSNPEFYPRVRDLPLWSLVYLEFSKVACTVINSSRKLIDDKNPDDGNSALHCAVSNNQVYILELLLEAGLSADVSNDILRRPLHTAVMHNNNAAARALLARDASTDPLDKWSLTPLDYIEDDPSRYETALTLIEAGADLSKTTDQRIQSLFFTAVEVNRIMAVKILINEGADPWTRNVSGQSALEMAKERGFREVEIYLKRNKSVYNTNSMIAGARDNHGEESKVAPAFKQPDDILEEEELNVEAVAEDTLDDALGQDGGSKRETS